ncbi:hypothetical protein V2J94_40130 [Streptomyces sp. DSM 41524]|uniref:Uncharacterized protein n=1 Tax=Streptomyces asiaticus subsp. ignotus TaxID=3098222 RepID=A0ABU7Q9D9_9ACTN|nr:hypothetical protein [Streptomyces sp. DSM 41524]
MPMVLTTPRAPISTVMLSMAYMMLRNGAVRAMAAALASARSWTSSAGLSRARRIPS